MRGGLHNPISPTPSAGTFFPMWPNYSNRVTGRYYGTFGAGAGNSFAVVANRIYTVPFLVFVTESFDRIGVRVETAAEGNARLGLYYDNNYAPSSLLLDAGEIDTGSTGDKEIVINLTLSPGLWWLSILFSATPSIRKHSPSLFSFLGLGAPEIVHGGSKSLYIANYDYGALPNPHPTPWLDLDSIPAICLRRA